MSIHEKASVGFDRAADSYDRGRPEYSSDAINFLIDQFKINQNSKILDLGAGTGKFTKLILPFSKNIVAIEPVEGMRNKFQSLINGVPILPGTAENLPLDSNSIDAVICAQAFHWFEANLAIEEIHRVLKPNGHLGLLWNVRDESFDWVKRLTSIIDPHESGAPRYKKMVWKKAFDETTFFSKLEHRAFNYIQSGNNETIVDRIASISFISSLAEDQRKQVLLEVRNLLSSHPQTKDEKTIQLPYKTDLYWSRKI